MKFVVGDHNARVHGRICSILVQHDSPLVCIFHTCTTLEYLVVVGNHHCCPSSASCTLPTPLLPDLATILLVVTVAGHCLDSALVPGNSNTKLHVVLLLSPLPCWIEGFLQSGMDQRHHRAYFCTAQTWICRCNERCKNAFCPYRGICLLFGTSTCIGNTATRHLK